jgi:hypothetical protein
MTNFPRAEPRLRTLLDTYVAIARQHTGIDDFLPPAGPLYAPARELAAELSAYRIGENSWEAFMWWAYKEYKRRFNGGPFKDHRSIKFLVKEFKGTPDDTSKYLRGVDGYSTEV